ncbi:MAG: hypothetical protein ACK59J_06780 [Pseudanabaena sp.]
MLPIKQRLTDLECLLEMGYEKLAEHQKESLMTSSANVRYESQMRIKSEIKPLIREYEQEYWFLLKQFANESDFTESEAQTAIATVVQEVELIQVKQMPNEVLQKLQQILDKLNEPGIAADAKVKFTLNLIPGILAYEFEIDTENTLRRIFNPIKQLFAIEAKKK